jgi:hypothetical protein
MVIKTGEGPGFRFINIYGRNWDLILQFPHDPFINTLRILATTGRTTVDKTATSSASRGHNPRNRNITITGKNVKQNKQKTPRFIASVFRQYWFNVADVTKYD